MSVLLRKGTVALFCCDDWVLAAGCVVLATIVFLIIPVVIGQWLGCKWIRGSFRSTICSLCDESFMLSDYDNKTITNVKDEEEEELKATGGFCAASRCRGWRLLQQLLPTTTRTYRRYNRTVEEILLLGRL